MKDKNKLYLDSFTPILEKIIEKYPFNKNTKKWRDNIFIKLKNYLETEFKEVYIICDESNNPKEVIKENFGIIDISVKYKNKIYINRITVLKTGSPVFSQFIK